MPNSRLLGWVCALEYGAAEEEGEGGGGIRAKRASMSGGECLVFISSAFSGQALLGLGTPGVFDHHVEE